MPQAINRALLTEVDILSRQRRGVKCVFISHQKNDAAICRKIADYLLNAGIDVYFDEYDSDLRIAHQMKSPKQVVNAIKKGINKSSHMLCVLSSNTLNSKWVPWEIGYGYDRTNLCALTLKGIADHQLPEYLNTIPIIRGTRTLNDYISNIEEQSLYRMFLDNSLTEHTKPHPLDSYLDFNL